MKINDQNIFIGVSKKEEIQSIKNLLRNEKLPVEGIGNNLNNFLSLYVNGLLVGTVGLEIYENKGLLRSLAVDKLHRGTGYGKILCGEIINKAKHENIDELFLLTETAPKFFASIGFEEIPRDAADDKIQTSEEFSTLCPSTATCMRLTLEKNIK